MKLTNRPFIVALVPLFVSVVAASAAITTIVDSSTDPAGATLLPAAALSPNLFNSGVACIQDRTHAPKVPGFQSDGRLTLSTTPDLSGQFPAYLVGQQFGWVKQNTRNLTNYTATISVDQDSTFYLLVDNRVSDRDLNGFSPFDDPVFGTNVLVYANANGDHCVAPTLANFPLTQWVKDSHWTRVNTGLSPDYNNPGYCINKLVQGDYLGIDENNDGTLNQFYAVYSRIVPAGGSVSVHQQALGVNMFCLVVSTNTPRAIKATVNSVNTTDTVDSELTLVEAVKWMNNPGYRALSQSESNQVTSIPSTQHLIGFNIPGTGPFEILDPPTMEITAANVVVDGYMQPGASPNTNPILAANNAVLKVVIKESDGSRAFTVHADNFWLRGVCLLNTRLAFDGEEYPNAGDYYAAVSGGGVQGCWIGVAPDGTTVDGGMSSGVATWYSLGGHVIGTDGDGWNDRNEFNVIVAADEFHVAVSSPNCRVSGNFINVMPSGMAASGYSGAECDGIYIEEIAHNLVIGTDSNGVSDEDERNVIGGLNGSGPCEVIGSWAGATTNVTVMGNYVGVAIDGTTPLPNKRGLAVDNPGLKMRVGSNEDGLWDALEANIIANTTANAVFKFNGPQTEIIFRRNSIFENAVNLIQDPQNSYNGNILTSGDLAAISPVVSNSTTRAELVGWVPVSSDPAAVNRTNAAIHIYEADPTAADDKPQGKKWLATYLDNGPQDLDPTLNYFKFNISSLAISAAGAKITVNETCGDDLGGGSSSFAAAVSLPDVVRTTLSIQKSGNNVVLTWQGPGVLQSTPSLSAPAVWTPVVGSSPVTLPIGAGPFYFRVAQ